MNRPPVSFMDSGQIKQVFLNVVLNSIEMTEEGGSIKVAEYFSENRLCVEISDTGSGLPDGKESQLFEPFFTTRRYGTGMGLAISKQIIEQHGGNISIKDRKDGIRGAMVNIELPLRDCSKLSLSLCIFVFKGHGKCTYTGGLV